MKGVLAILGLVACATAFQYNLPQYGRHGYGDNLLSGIYGSFQGPYNKQFYQRFGKQYDQDYQNTHDVYQKNDEYEQGHQMYNDQENNQGMYDLYKALYNKYYKGMYNKYMGKVQNYLKNNQGEDYEEYQPQYNQHQPQYYGNNQEEESQYKYEQFKSNDKYFTKKQQDVYQLLKFINNQVYDNEYMQIYKNFDIEKFAQYYHPEAYKNFMHLWTNKMFLPKGEIFSVFNDVHVEQVKALFKLFYTAKDYDTFFQTAVWARQNMNEGMFLYTFSVAIVQRQDTQEIILPPIYEIYPQYFFNSEVMQKAYMYKMSHYGSKQQQMGQNTVYTIPANYSGFYLNLNPEQSLSYYLEDVGINAFYYYHSLYFPYWLDSEEFPMFQRRGELFYYIHQQLLAKYYLERLSHGIGGIEYFNWDLPFETGYYPSLTYPNGLAFSERPNFANLQEYLQNYGQHWCFISKYGYGYTYVQTYEQRIREAIDIGYVYTYDGKKIDLYTQEGMNILGNIIEGNADSVNERYYGSYVNFARHLLGYSKQPLDNYKLAPSALEHFETSMRDPAFYKLFKKVTLLVQKYKHNLPAYTKKDLYFPGVKVQKIEVDPLMTFYDKFYADITNGLTVTPEEYKTDSTFKVQVQQYRLNHKNFNYKVYVDSDKTTKATVKVFLGPKYDEHGRTMDYAENRMNFIELDQFVYTLKTGQNMIVRNSKQFTWFAKDKTSYYNLYKNLMNQGNTYQMEDTMFGGYPQRFMLPRGSEAGMTYQLYVIVYPYMPYQGEHQTKYVQMTQENTNTYDKYVQFQYASTNNYPWGYPFDRPAEFEQVYFVPNAYMKDVKIYHKILKTEYETRDYINEEPKYFM